MDLNDDALYSYIKEREERWDALMNPGGSSAVPDLSKFRAGLRVHHGGPGPHKDGSPQDVHGKKGAGASAAPAPRKVGRLGDVHSDARRTFDMLAKGGGFTYQAVGDFSPTDGFMVSPYQGRESVIPQASLSYGDIAEFLVNNKDLLQQDDHYLGGWVYQGKVYLDVSIRAGSEAAAREISKKHKQIAYFDLAGQREVVVNAKGTRAPLSYTRMPDDSLGSFRAWLQLAGESLGLKGKVPEVLAERYWRKFAGDQSKGRTSLRAHHYGPGPHKDGSSQDVHGGGGAGSASTTSTPGGNAKASGSRSQGRKVARMTWRDIDGETHEADVFKVDQWGDLPQAGMGVFGLSGQGRGEFLYSPNGENYAGSATHGQMVRAVHPGGSVDDYVRFYFTPGGIEFSVTSAAVEVSGNDWADRAMDNIYQTMDRMASAGVSGDTPVTIRRGPQSKWIKTTVK